MKSPSLPNHRPGPTYRYDCFISYAHEDSASVDWLERVLARTWVPGRRRRRVFVDRSQITAGGLNETLRQALADSRYLVVCCSPAALRSPWINLEIDAFAHSRPEGSGHGSREILACLVGEHTDTLPSALQWVQWESADELFLPDLTGAPSGWSRARRKHARHEALALLAPIVGVRDREALLARRVKTLLALALIALLAGGAYAGWRWWLTTAAGHFYSNRKELLARAGNEELVDRQLLQTAAAFGRLGDRDGIDALSRFIEERDFQNVLLAAGLGSMVVPDCSKLTGLVEKLDSATVRTWPEGSLLAVSRCDTPMPAALSTVPPSLPLVRHLSWAGLAERARTAVPLLPSREQLDGHVALAVHGFAIPADLTRELAAWVSSRDPFDRLSNSLELLAELDAHARLHLPIAARLLDIALEAVADTDVSFANTWSKYQELSARLAGAGRSVDADALLRTYAEAPGDCPKNASADGLAWRALATLRTGGSADSLLAEAEACAAQPIPATRTWAEWRTIATVYALADRWPEAFAAAVRPEDDRVRLLNRAYMIALWEQRHRS